MKKTVIVCVCVCIALCGCATIKIEAPVGRSVTLAPNADTEPVIAQKRVFYALYGLVPLSNNSTAPMIENTNAKSICAKTYYDVIDYLLSGILGYLTITTKSVEIRGK